MKVFKIIVTKLKIMKVFTITIIAKVFVITLLTSMKMVRKMIIFINKTAIKKATMILAIIIMIININNNDL